MTIKLQVMGKQSRDLRDMILDLPTMQQYHFLMKIIFLEHNLSLKRYCLRNIQQYSAISGEACFKNFNFSYENIEFIRDCLPGSMNCYVFYLVFGDKLELQNHHSLLSTFLLEINFQLQFPGGSTFLLSFMKN